MNAPLRPVSRRQGGFLLIAAIVLIVSVGLLGASLIFVMSGNIGAAVGHHGAAQALFLAESGLERGVFTATAPNLGVRQACANVNVANVALGNGAYTVTGTAPVYAAATTVNMGVGGLSAAATTITVTSTAGYAARGRIMIDRELIDYSRLTATTFEVAARGAGGTTAVAHASGTPIGQDQCDLTATGGLPNVAGAEGRRQLRHGVQLQEGWAMGAAAFPTPNNLNGIYCFPGGTDCWAVGTNGTILRWNGATWAAVASPVGAGTTLRAVSCVSATTCWIVGNVSGGELILYLDGAGNWQRQPVSPAIPNVNLNGIHCLQGSNYCWAVGNTVAGGPGAGEVTIRWTGGAWGRVGPGPAPNTNLTGVYCAAVDDCWAVGNTVAGGPGAGEVTIRWTGGPNWTRTGPGPAPDTNLLSVHCAAATNNCWTVGVPSAGGEVTVQWTGGPNWTPNGPDPAIPNVNLNSVYCVATNDCWAVGNFSGNDFVIARWTVGPNWAYQPLTDAFYRQNLNGVSCLNANDCWAVGNAGRVVRWNGTSWSLYGVNATVLRWDSTSWTNVSTTLAPGGITQLNSVSPLSYADGWAVGNPTAATTNGWLFLRWNGTSWVRPVVNTPGATALNLNGVHVLSATDGWVVGNTGGGGGGGCTNNRARILRWNGTTWGCTASPSNQNLNSVSMVSATDGWAVGNTGGAGGGTCTNNMARILRWNNPVANAWSCVASPSNQSLNSVSMVSATDGWAVGNSGAGGGGACTNNRARILRWNGAAWSCVASPALQNLYSVYMVSATDGWAVGQVLTAGPATQRWNVLRWNSPVANAWNVITVNTAGVNAQILQEVACIKASDCWVVGNAGARLHWDGTIWSAVTAPAVASNLFGLGLIGPRTRPQAGWQEVYP